MPKDRRERSMSLDRSRLSPYPCSSSCSRQSLPKNPPEDDNNIEQWEEARCPVCMEHPHNAILLLCSSHDKGCRPFMCDTSYRHSNCFDQFRKSSCDSPPEVLSGEDVQNPLFSTTAVSEAAVSNQEGETAVSNQEGETAVSNQDGETAVSNQDGETAVSNQEDEGDLEEGSMSVLSEASEKTEKPNLVCPLCRGEIDGWTVVKSARDFMNRKSRSCASETCDFSGTYKDLRKHARLVHPLVRPTEADPERQTNWRRLERQRDLGDLLSTLQSSFGDERNGESTLTIDEGGWLTVFFLVRFIRPGNTSTRSSTRARAQVAVNRSLRRRLWGETYNGEADSRDEENEDDTDNGPSDPTPRRYVRRRYRNNESSE